MPGRRHIQDLSSDYHRCLVSLTGAYAIYPFLILRIPFKNALKHVFMFNSTLKNMNIFILF